MNGEARRRTRGFTLIEVVLVMAMLGLVLSITYGILLDCFETDRRIDKLTIPEKVGEGIISLIRSDLSGTIYRNLGKRVFFVADSGAPPDARDEIRFLSTVEPTPREETEGGSTVAVQELRTLTGIGYFLRPSPNQENVACYTLFRKEMVDFDLASPLEAAGVNYEVYDKVHSFSIECFDGWSWFPDWDSEVRIHAEKEEADALAAAGEGRIARVSDPQVPSPLQGSAPGVDPNAASEGEVLPPAAIPLAVRVEVSIYVAIGNRFERDASGNPIVKTYSTIVPILAAQRIPIDIEDEALEGGAGVGGEEGEEGLEGAGGPGAATFGGAPAPTRGGPTKGGPRPSRKGGPPAGGGGARGPAGLPQPKAGGRP